MAIAAIISRSTYFSILVFTKFGPMDPLPEIWPAIRVAICSLTPYSNPSVLSKIVSASPKSPGQENCPQNPQSLMMATEIKMSMWRRLVV